MEVFMATKKKNEELVEAKETKPKKKPRGKNIGETLSPVTEPGDNAKYISVSLKLFNMPSIDLHKPELVQERLTEYFEIHVKADLKPTVAGMAMALGIDRRRLWEIKSGNYHTSSTLADLPFESTDSIKKAYDFLENLWENYMNNGKINPVSGIFLAKNNFGYQDKVEHVLTPNMNNSTDYSAEDIRARYLSDSPTIEQLSDSPDFEEK
jgi:hypothetical protein